MEINAVNQTNTPTFYSKTQQNPLMGSALHEAFPTFQTTRGTTRKRTVYLKSQNKDSLREEEEEEEEGEDDDDDDDERIEVKRKIVALQRIVPGGEALGVDKLFEETAGYILALQGQIRAMRVLTSFIEGMDKQKRKLGG
ncbi:transcription factor PAR1-like [Gossypium arboreum]|nr:transcription factor PAR1-like [Gossypium arboreum]